MKKKINVQFAITTMVAILFAVLLSFGVFYGKYQEEVMGSLKAYAHALQLSDVFHKDNVCRQLAAEDQIRITLINPDGSIAFESDADISFMGDHSGRPEVRKAFETGSAEAVRKSATMGKNTFYYAVKLENGQVFRTAKEAGNILSFWISILPYLIVAAALLVLLCVGMSHILVKSILRPIEDMACHMDDEAYHVPYKELEPFMDTIRKQHEDIIKSTQIRQDFTANVSHELKTPLTAISGYSELIENGIPSKQETVRFAAEIHKSSGRLLTLINDIIRLSELDVAEQVVQMELLNLYDLAEKCVDMLQISAEKHQVILKLEGEQCMIRANREMMEELLYNLCSNAIRYNVCGGSVRILVKKDGNHGILTVEDTGIGIPKEDQERIFERFYRVDKSRSKATGGTGLGLAIVKHVVAKHDAGIELHSEVGKGSRITVTLHR